MKGRGKKLRFTLLVFNCKYMIAWALIPPPLVCALTASADVTGMRTRLCFFPQQSLDAG